MIEEKHKKAAIANYVFISLFYALSSIMLSNGFAIAIYPITTMLGLGSIGTIIVYIANISKNVKKSKIDYNFLIIQLMTKIVIALTIYQLYLLGYVFLSGMFATILIINFVDNILKLLE